MPSLIAQSAAEYVNQQLSGSQNEPEVVALAGGGYVVVWHGTSDLDDFSWGVLARVFDDSGNPLGDVFRINQSWISHERDPDVVALDDGGFFVSWRGMPGTGDAIETTFANSMGRYFDANGNATSDEFLLDDVDRYEGDVSLTTLSNGDIVAAYYREIGGDYYNDIVFRILPSDPSLASTEFNVLGETDDNDQLDGQNQPHVLALSNDNILVVWDDDRFEEGRIQARIFDNEGTPLVDDFAINVSTFGSWRFSVAPLENGGFVAVYMGYADDDNVTHHVYAQVFGADGTAVGDTIDVGATSPYTSPSVLSLPDGGFLIAYESEGLTLQRYDAIGDTVGEAESHLGGDLSLVEKIDLALIDGDTVVATWQTGYGGEIAQRLFSLVNIQTGTDNADVLVGSGRHDEISGLDENDRLFGYGNDDWLFGDAGEDVLSGGGGTDELDGGADDDRLNGNPGDDILLGGDGNDIMNGGAGDDVMDGQTGDDTMIGHLGLDTFVFSEGADTVRFFSTDDDVIDLSGEFSIRNFIDLSNNHMTQVGRDVVIENANGDTMTLTFTDLADLSAESFVF